MGHSPGRATERHIGGGGVAGKKRFQHDEPLVFIRGEMEMAFDKSPKLVKFIAVHRSVGCCDEQAELEESRCAKKVGRRLLYRAARRLENADLATSPKVACTVPRIRFEAIAEVFNRPRQR